MAKTSWFNDNEYRSYPFAETASSTLPFSIIVDCGFVLGPTVIFDPKDHIIYLASISREGNVFSFVFRSTAPALSDYSLVFSGVLPETPYCCWREINFWDDNEASLTDVSWSFCGDSFDWEGFLVLGQPAALTALLPEDGTIIFEEPVEPARVASLYASYISALRVINTDRTRATAPEQCDALIWPHPCPATIFAGCLEGEIRLVDGFNCRIELDAAENSITVNAVSPETQESLAGPPLAEIPLFLGESPPANRTRLDGALSCNEVFRTINGIPGPTVDILNGPGVSCEQDVENHRLIVSVHMTDMAICPEENANSSSEEDCPPFNPCEAEE